ncbi:AfsR/SARP family transcriptional regulator [Paractinoplanes rishiriensis]|uniref:SARP family transcriptional regulator n=1 Tax=Paractinoplanes rishiriensis TaxID=1050105 RepID=A0A919N0L3_9ACTN|nr:BTAD domain-containing putative transcriptional regulator [Actinoplanes rishiriensis]GIE99770.1 SARP family transcriptional regulator [Actinoplanes rishiriensis]
MTDLELRVLGAVESRAGTTTLTLGPRKQRFVLAVLALEVNRPVAVDRLVDLAWPVSPPRTAGHAIQVCISGLRAAFAGHDGLEIHTDGPSYRLAADPMRIDAHRFRALLGAAADAGDDTTRLALLAEALALWTGPPLHGVAPPEIGERLGAGLTESWRGAIEDAVDARLRLGQHRELVDELTALAAAEPHRERLAAQLMLALYRCGRTGDALAVARATRQRLADELGLDPGPHVQRLELAIMRQDPALLSPAGRDRGGVVPAQLPAPVVGFAGRDEQLDEVDALVPADGGAVVVTVVGAAGVGKTALAVQWAQRRRDRFPDGQLYLNLGGYGGSPVPPGQALGTFLRALGTPAEQVPVDPVEAGALYRSLVADRRMLVVLDNAAGPDQVRPLLPGGTRCATLVTSRERLTGLVARDGARPVTLAALPAGEATALLTGLLGARATGDPAGTAELARLCGRLPLALRIAAAHLACRPRLLVADLVAELGAGDRLGMLAVPGDDQHAVRAAFDLSYAALRPETSRLFRLAGLTPGGEVTAPSAAAAADLEPPRAARLLAELADAHLVEELAPGRYALHDLLHLYAAELAEAEDPPHERAAARHRLYDWHLSGVSAAGGLLYPQMQRLPLPDGLPVRTFGGPAAALAWLDAERAALVALVRHGAADPALHRHAWLLADALRGYFWTRRHAADWLACAGAGLAAAEAGGDPRGQAAAHLSLAQASRSLSRHDDAIRHFGAARSLAARAGWRQGAAAALGSSANVYRDLGRLAESADQHRQALLIYRENGGRGGEAVCLGNLGNVLVESGRLDEGIERLTEGMALYRELGSAGGQAMMHNSLGYAHLGAGRTDEALAAFDRALALHREAGSREGEADTLVNIGEAHRDAGRYAEATRIGRAGLDLAVDTGDRRVEADAHNLLGSIHTRSGEPGPAADRHRAALRLADDEGHGKGTAAAQLGLAEAHLAAGRAGDAYTAAVEALDVAHRTGFGLLEADARTVAAAAALAGAAGPQPAAEHARQARDAHRRIGRPAAERLAQQLLDQAAAQIPGISGTGPSQSSGGR